MHVLTNCDRTLVGTAKAARLWICPFWEDIPRKKKKKS